MINLEPLTQAFKVMKCTIAGHNFELTVKEVSVEGFALIIDVWTCSCCGKRIARQSPIRPPMCRCTIYPLPKEENPQREWV